ncbi:MAG: choice-of-anchor D domain-containing protein [Candidatus Kapaibacterium sp.]
MRLFLAAFCFLAVLPAMGAAQLRLETDKDTIDYTIVKFGFYRDVPVRATNISLTTVNVNLAKIVDQNSAPNEFQIIVPQPPVFHIDSGDGRTIIVRFTPSGPGLRTAVLDLMTDDGDKHVQLLGIGATIQPDILMQPQSIDFGMLAPGEHKDTTIFVIGSDKDSATIDWIGVNNDNGEVDFDVTPIDPNVTFPLIIRKGDTLKLNARFTGMNASGPRTGRTIMEGEVSGEVVCEFRGGVGVPDMAFTPQLLDLGIVPQGVSVDTFITIASIGQSPVNLQRIDKPKLPYSISGLPSFPFSVAPGDSIRIAVHFDAAAPGDFEEGMLAYSKNGSETALNRTALLKAIVIPHVLSVNSPQPFVVSCAVDSVYLRTVTISDTGRYPITVSRALCADSGFSLTYPVSFPDTIPSGVKRDILVTFQSGTGAFTSDTFCVVTIMSGSRVIIADTIHITRTTENARFGVAQISPATMIPNSNTIGVVTVSDLARYKLTSLKLDLAIDPPDVAVIDTLNVTVDNSIFPNAVVKAGYDNAAKKYTATLTSTTELPSSPVIPFLHVPLKYFVAKDSSAVLHVSMHSPEKDGCVNFADESVTISSASGCGDQEIRHLFENVPLISKVTIAPNPVQGRHISVSFFNSADILLSADLLDLQGKIIIHHDELSLTKGWNTLALETASMASGAYSIQLSARTPDGHLQHITGSIILSH